MDKKRNAEQKLCDSKINVIEKFTFETLHQHVTQFPWLMIKEKEKKAPTIITLKNLLDIDRNVDEMENYMWWSDQNKNDSMVVQGAERPQDLWLVWPATVTSLDYNRVSQCGVAVRR